MEIGKLFSNTIQSVASAKKSFIGRCRFALENIRQQSDTFFSGSSFFFEYEEIQPFTEFNHDVRWSNYLSWFINKPNYAFTAVTYYQANVQDFKDYRISGQYTFFFKLKKNLDFKVEFSNNFDSKPPQTVRNWIFSSTFGIVLKLG